MSMWTSARSRAAGDERMSLLKTSAITLRSRKWGEADRIVTFFSLRFGKLRGVARGARGARSRFGSALEPFAHCELNLFERGRDPLYRITQADVKETHAALREDLTLMGGAARLVNLVEAVSAEGDAGPQIFETLLAAFRALSSSDDPALAALLYQIRLLGHTGFQPKADHCAACGSMTGSDDGRFSPLAGGLVCAACAARRRDRSLEMSPGAWAFLQQALALPLPLLQRLRATGQVRDELTCAIEAYVTLVAGKRLPPIDFLAAEARPPAYGAGP
jgi:DNA repair protein RecO (recombination protein O)